MIKRAINHFHTLDRAVRECVAVLIIGIGGAGRVAARTAFRASRTLHGIECPHVALVEFDLTSQTGRQDTDLVMPSTPGRLIVHIVQPVNAASLVERFGNDKTYAPFKAVDPDVIRNLPQTDHLGGCAVPAGARIAIEVHEQAIAELAVNIGQLADVIRRPQAEWRCTGSLWVIVHASSAGAVGSNDIHISDMLCRRIRGQHRVLSSGLLIAENGRVPDRNESLALEAAHMSAVRAVARHTPRSTAAPFAHNIDHWTYFRQSQADERDVYAAAATTTALVSAAALGGELHTLETRTNRLSEGERVFLCETRAVRHSSDKLAEFARCWAIERGAQVVVDRADLRPAAIVTQYSNDWQELGSTEQIASRACTGRLGGTGAVVAELRKRLAARTPDESELERAVIAELPSAVQDVRLDDSIRSVERQLRTLADEHRARAIEALTAGRPDEALAIADVMRAYGAARTGEVDVVQREANDQAETSLADANAAVAGTGDADELRAGGGLIQLWNWFASWFTGQSDAPTTDVDVQLHGNLETFAATTLRSRLAGRLRTVFGLLARCADELTARVEEDLALLRTLSALAADHRRRVEQNADTLKADIAGLVTVADCEIREAALRSVLPEDTDDTLRSIVMASVESARSRRRRVEVSEVFADAVEQVGQITDRLRTMDLDGLIRILDDSGLVKLAAALQPESTIDFRADQPRPQHTVRYAVPGGEGGPLGRWLRVNLRDVQPVITDSRGSQVAYAVCVTAPFAVDDIHAYHTTYAKARDWARQRGRESYLLSDRRHLGLDDGILTDERIDAVFIRGLVSGAIGASPGGRFYMIPDGEHRRPADVKPGEIDAIFGRIEKGGGRLGNSVPDFRASLRASAQIRDALQARWSGYLLGTSPEGRLQRIEALQREGLPSPELGNALRQLRAVAQEEVIRHGRRGDDPGPVPTRVDAPRRPGPVSGIKAAVRSEA